MLKAGRNEQILQRVRVHGSHVRQVADVALEEREPARGVDRLEHDWRAGAELLERGVEQLRQVSRLQVLDDLRGEQSAE